MFFISMHVNVVSAGLHKHNILMTFLVAIQWLVSIKISFFIFFLYAEFRGRVSEVDFDVETDFVTVDLFRSQIGIRAKSTSNSL